MDSHADSDKHMNDHPSHQCSSVSDPDGRICDRQQQIELCTMILHDLLHIQRIVKERGLENASLQGLDN